MIDKRKLPFNKILYMEKNPIISRERFLIFILGVATGLSIGMGVLGCSRTKEENRYIFNDYMDLLEKRVSTNILDEVSEDFR